MTKNEVFDLICAGFAKQGWQRASRVNSDGSGAACYVRIKRKKKCALKCAVGILVTDEEYEKYGEDVSALRKQVAYRLGIKESFLLGAQRVHDTTKSSRELIGGMKAFAALKSLFIPDSLRNA